MITRRVIDASILALLALLGLAVHHLGPSYDILALAETQYIYAINYYVADMNSPHHTTHGTKHIRISHSIPIMSRSDSRCPSVGQFPASLFQIASDTRIGPFGRPDGCAISILYAHPVKTLSPMGRNSAGSDGRYPLMKWLNERGRQIKLSSKSSTYRKHDKLK